MNSYSSALEMYKHALAEAPQFDFVGVISVFNEENAKQVESFLNE